MKLFPTTTLVFAALMALTVLPAHAVYKCVDEKGITHYGDTMPPQCEKKPVKEITNQGTVVRQYDAPLTPEQLRAQAEDRERRKEGEKRIAEQKLRDNALLATYGSEREFDVARDKDLAALDARKKTLLSRNADVDKYLAKTENEMEFYKAGKSKAAKGKGGKVDPKAEKPKEKEAPPQLVQDYNRAKSDRVNLDTELAKVDVDRAAVTARYEAEKVRWKKLKSGMQPGTLLDEKGEVAVKPDLPSQIVGQSTIIPGRARGTADCNGKTYECSLGLMYICRGPNIGGPGVNAMTVKCNEARR